MSSSTKLGLFVLAILFLLVAGSYIFRSHNQTELIKISHIFGSNIRIFDFQSSALRAIVQKNFQNQPGEYAVVVEEMVVSGEGEKYSVNANTPFPAASLYKLILLAAAQQQIADGTLTKEEMLSATKTHLSEIFGGVDFGYEQSGEQISYSVDEAMIRIGRISDNFAAIMLNERLRKNQTEDPLVKMAKQLNLFQTTFAELPTTCAKDVATYFKALYRGEIVSKTASEDVIRILELSQLNNRIPEQLPKDIRVIHKTGELAGVRHDAGIVYLDKHPYIVVLLSKDLPFEDDGVQNLSNISKAVFDYFSNKK